MTHNEIQAVIYCRSATTHQQLDNQLIVCQEAAKRHGYRVTNTFIDKGISGNTLERPQLKNMLNYLKEAPNDTAVIVENTSRLARDMRVFVEVRDAIQQTGSIIMTSTALYDSSPDSELAQNMMAALTELRASQGLIE
jgi:DNA invertase Pin-like site-specific DNA recombinase